MIKTYEDHLYRVKISLIYLEKLEKVKAFLKRFEPTEEDFFSGIENAAGRCGWIARDHIAIIILDKKGSISTMAHECFHVVSLIFRRKGIRLTEASEEAYAYYYGFVFDKLCQWVVSKR